MEPNEVNEGDKMHEGPVVNEHGATAGEVTPVVQPVEPAASSGVDAPHYNTSTTETTSAEEADDADFADEDDDMVDDDEEGDEADGDSGDESDPATEGFDSVKEEDKNPAMLEPSTATRNNPDIPDPPPTDPLIPAHPGTVDDGPVRAGFNTATPAAG